MKKKKQTKQNKTKTTQLSPKQQITVLWGWLRGLLLLCSPRQYTNQVSWGIKTHMQKKILFLGIFFQCK